MLEKFFKNKRVFITGHSGFKGAWLCLWLTKMGAEVTGYALEPPTKPSLFEECKIEKLINSIYGDVRNLEQLKLAMKKASPEIVIHMAAQPLVRKSYRFPIETFDINVMGTVNLLEAVRYTDSVRVVVNVTTDKVYENKEWIWGYRENEPLGGYDPYSSSKACSELVTAAYRNSYFNPNCYHEHRVAIATVRAGNVIGGGDWAADRLIPDCMRALLAGEKIIIRNPHAIRPWQHVLDLLYGYMMLVERLYNDGPNFVGSWNFGPMAHDSRTVEWIVKKICNLWGKEPNYIVDTGDQPHETSYLRLDCTKVRTELKWSPSWALDIALKKIIEWYHAFKAGEDMVSFSLKQIKEFERAISNRR